jgi:hypothetical protein
MSSKKNLCINLSKMTKFRFIQNFPALSFTITLFVCSRMPGRRANFCDSKLSAKRLHLYAISLQHPVANMDAFCLAVVSFSDNYKHLQFYFQPKQLKTWPNRRLPKVGSKCDNREKAPSRCFDLRQSFRIYMLIIFQ